MTDFEKNIVTKIVTETLTRSDLGKLTLSLAKLCEFLEEDEISTLIESFGYILSSGPGYFQIRRENITVPIYTFYLITGKYQYAITHKGIEI